jgi:hypothetical protein
MKETNWNSNDKNNGTDLPAFRFHDFRRNLSHIFQFVQRSGGEQVHCSTGLVETSPLY